jgi:hypothetical protein
MVVVEVWPMKKNLAMHVYPKIDPGHWRRAVAHVRARLSQFTGRRLVSVAVDTSTERASAVCDAFGGEVEIREVHNDGIQEMVSFPWLMEQVIDGSDDLTFYCHAKGCTHRENQSSHLWCDAMASACLDYPALVDHAMRSKPICGAFRSRQQVGTSEAVFHFAGTFWWVRNSALHARDWQRSDPEFWGAESYPGRHFQPHESACLFFDRAETAHLYNLAWWQTVVCPAYRQWRAEFDRRGITPLAYDPALLWPQFREWTT